MGIYWLQDVSRNMQYRSMHPQNHFIQNLKADIIVYF